MKPPGPHEQDDLDEEYLRASALDPSRPGEAVRRAVLDHAAKLAAERAVKQGGMSAKRGRPVAGRAGWRSAILGSLAAAALAGILIAPHYLGPRAPPATADRSALRPRSDGSVPPPRSPAAQAPAAGADSALKSMAGAARNSAAPEPRESAPGDPAAALRRAAENGDAEKLTALLGAIGDIDARDGEGRTALMLAALHGQTGAVGVLLSHGADPNAADARGMTPLQAAEAGNRQEIIRALRRAGAR